MDQNNSGLSNVHSDSVQLGSEIQDSAEENDEQTTIMLKIDHGSDNMMSQESDEMTAGEITFCSEDNDNVQTIQNVGTELPNLEHAQVVLQTLRGSADQNMGNESAVTGTFVADAVTLQSLIASGAVQITDAAGQPLQFVTLSNDPSSSVSTSNTTTTLNTTSMQNFAPGTNISHSIVNKVDTSEAENTLITQLQENQNIETMSIGKISLLGGPPPIQDLPPDTPPWAARLHDCQKIGDFYRGWLSSEIELDLVLTLHKQQTQTMWGTRQSPCPSKPATRLMWKSQYVPFDGMPFLNAGSRAIVMECQYGPRRKGSQTRKDEMAALKPDFKQTCPARIYIKKVKKFLEYQVTVDTDKKTTKAAMDKAFQMLKEKDYEGLVQERYYVQLPTETAHEFHATEISPADTLQKPSLGATATPSRVHPIVSERIRHFVSMGETRLYAIRKQLRKFVEKEMFEIPENVPDRHNLHYFPTVNDLQNHIHQAIRDIEAGILPVSAEALNLELVSDSSQLQNTVWQPVNDASPHAETVTVTLTQGPGEESHMISKVETNLSDGSTQVSPNLTSETARLLSRLHPQMFSSLNQNGQQQVSVQLPVSSDSSLESQLVNASLSSASNNTTNADTTITVTIPNVKQDINQANLSTTFNVQAGTQAEEVSSGGAYAVLQTDAGAILLTKTNILPNGETATGPGVFTVDAGHSSIIQALSEGGILQQSNISVLDIGPNGQTQPSLQINENFRHKEQAIKTAKDIRTMNDKASRNEIFAVTDEDVISIEYTDESGDQASQLNHDEDEDDDDEDDDDDEGDNEECEDNEQGDLGMSSVKDEHHHSREIAFKF